jgi:predicted PurR-regulated permease PerM
MAGGTTASNSEGWGPSGSLTARERTGGRVASRRALTSRWGRTVYPSRVEDDRSSDGGAPRWRPPGWTQGRAAPIAAGVAGGLLLAQAASAIFSEVRGLLLIVVVSLFLSFALEPAVQWLALRGLRRGIGTGLVFFAGIALLGGFVAVMAGLVIEQVRALVDGLPLLLSNLAAQAERLPGEVGTGTSEWLSAQRQLAPGMAGAGAVGRGALGVGQTVIGGLFQLATIALVTFYLVADGPKLRFRLASRLPQRQQVRVLGVWELAIAKTGGYVYSRLLTAVVSALFHISVFTLLDLPSSIALGVWVGLISSLIPAVGTYLAGALPVVVALASSPTQALWVLAAIVAYQQVENYVVVPRITAQTLELHPALAFLSVLAGGALAGATGALLAIPAVAIATALLSAAAEEHDVLEHHLVASGPQAARDLVDRLEADRSHVAAPAATPEAPSDEPQGSSTAL